MRAVFNIARAELQVLFYSPVAWLILIVFSFQIGLVYTGAYDDIVHYTALGRTLSSVTLPLFGGLSGLFTIVQNYLYLYIPLLTMGIMSREFSSGSIKLLYSSPLTNFQIVVGKYLALVLYALVIIVLLSVYSMHSIIVIENVQYEVILTGLLGVFLMICAYAAIGLFMSSLTSYTVVAAMGTLAIFAFLSMMRGLWQEIELVREITYWLSISGRASTFVQGMITSEDVLYFLIIIVLFVAFSIFKLERRQKNVSTIASVAKYSVTVILALGFGYLSTLPSIKKYIDVTYSKVNTLTEASQRVVSKLKGPLTIHTYVNLLEENYRLGLPSQYMGNIKLFEPYVRFKPNIKFKTHYYYHKAKFDRLDRQFPRLTDKERIDTLRHMHQWNFKIAPYSEIHPQFDLETESFRFVRVLDQPGNRHTFLRVFDDMARQPSEAEITAAFKRLVMDLPTVAFVTGQNERSTVSLQDRGYRMVAQQKSFRHALVNQGFDFKDISLDNPVPTEVNILVIAEPRMPYNESQLANLQQYIDRGGNLILATEPAGREYVEPITSMLGVSILPGVLVHSSEVFQPDLLLLRPTREATTFSHHLEQMARNRHVLTMPGASALEFDRSHPRGFHATPLFATDSKGSWNELQTTNFIDDSVSMDGDGEIEQPHATVLALEREINGRTQKILVTGDADWLSNAELGMSRNGVRAANYSLVSAAFFWLSDEEVPVDMRREPPIDRKISTTENSWKFSKFGFKWGVPLILILMGALIWVRRRGR